MRVYSLGLGERATLRPSASCRELIEQAKSILPGRLPEQMAFDGQFHAWSVESEAAPFPPAVTSLEGLIDCLVMERSAARVVGERMGIDVQMLIVDTSAEGVEYDLVHPCGELVPIDEIKATIRLFRSANKVRAIDRYAFKPADIDGQYLFRASLRPHILLCTEEFCRDAEEHDWKPLYFSPVWDSEHEPFAHTPSRAEIASRPEVYGPKGFKAVSEQLMPKEWLRA